MISNQTQAGSESLGDRTGNKDTNLTSTISFDMIKKEGVDLIRSTRSKYEISGEDLMNMKVEKPKSLIEDLLPQNGIVALAGTSDCGKSAFLRQMVVALCSDTFEFIDFKINSRFRSALYVSTEDNKENVAFLLNKLRGSVAPESIRNLRYIFDCENVLKLIDKSLENQKADIVIIDAFSDVFDGKLVDTQNVRAFLNKFQKLSEKHDCLIMFLHHTGKRTENLEPNKNNLLAGQGFEAKARLLIELRPDYLNPHLRHMCIVKGNYLPKSMKQESFVLKFDEDTLTFSNTGERTPFEMLSKGLNHDNSRAKYIEAKRLKDEGKTYEQIAKIMGYESKGTIAKLFSKYKDEPQN